MSSTILHTNWILKEHHRNGLWPWLDLRLSYLIPSDKRLKNDSQESYVTFIILFGAILQDFQYI